MAFKKIILKQAAPLVLVNPERVKAVQPTDINVGQLRPDIVKWDQVDYQDWRKMKLDVLYNQVGSVYTIGRFNPLAENNFCLWIKADQTEYANKHGYYRVILLNEDLSPKLGPNGDQVIQMIEGYKLDYTGIIAIGEMHL